MFLPSPSSNKLRVGLSPRPSFLPCITAVFCTYPSFTTRADQMYGSSDRPPNKQYNPSSPPLGCRRCFVHTRKSIDPSSPALLIFSLPFRTSPTEKSTHEFRRKRLYFLPPSDFSPLKRPSLESFFYFTISRRRTSGQKRAVTLVSPPFS